MFFDGFVSPFVPRFMDHYEPHACHAPTMLPTWINFCTLLCLLCSSLSIHSQSSPTGMMASPWLAICCKGVDLLLQIITMHAKICKVKPYLRSNAFTKDDAIAEINNLQQFGQVCKSSLCLWHAHKVWLKHVYAIIKYVNPRATAMKVVGNMMYNTNCSPNKTMDAWARG